MSHSTSAQTHITIECVFCCYAKCSYAAHTSPSLDCSIEFNLPFMDIFRSYRISLAQYVTSIFVYITTTANCNGTIYALMHICICK